MAVTTTKSLLSEVLGKAATKLDSAINDTPMNDKDTKNDAVCNDTTAPVPADALKDVPELSPSVMSGIRELHMIMAGSVPDATPPSQNVLGSPPKRDITMNPLARSTDADGVYDADDTTDADDERNGLAIPPPRWQ